MAVFCKTQTNGSMKSRIEHLPITWLVVLSLLGGCGSGETSNSTTSEFTRCKNAGPRDFCNRGAEGVRLHIEEFGEFPEEMDSISITDFDRVEDLAPLKKVKKAQRVSIYASRVEDLSFLSGLEETVALRIGGNSKITSLRGLENLREVTILTEITANAELRNLEGLDSLQIGSGPQEAFFVFENPKMESLDGMDSLEQVHNLTVQNNMQLKTLGSFPALKQASCSAPRRSSHV